MACLIATQDGAIPAKRGTEEQFSAVELILNAANINFVAFSKFNGMNLDGHIFGLLVIVLAAAEAAVALAIIINMYNNMNSINVDEAAGLRH